MEMITDTITTMRRQERFAYKKRNWVEPDCVSAVLKTACRSRSRSCEVDAVDADCRSKVAGWFLRLVEACNFSVETVEIAMSLLDRFVATKAGSQARADRDTFQLAAMAALYVAVKAHETRAIDSSLLANLSCGVHSAKDVEKMEMKLVRALQWRLNPPTSFSFARNLMQLVPTDILGKDMRQIALNLTLSQIEIVITDPVLVTDDASTVAYSAMMNTFETLGLQDGAVNEIGAILSKALQVDLPNAADHKTTQQRCARIQIPSISRTRTTKSLGCKDETSVSPRAVARNNAAY